MRPGRWIVSESERDSQVSLPPLIAIAVAAGAVAAGAFGGMPMALIFLSASALCLTIALVWNSLGRMGQGARLDFEDALELAAPTATEEQKLAVLRALKELEYELSVGKISREDFDVASAEYRAQARQLIAAQDESMKAQIAAAEARVARHLQTSQTDPKSSDEKPSKESTSSSDPPEQSESASA